MIAIGTSLVFIRYGDRSKHKVELELPDTQSKVRPITSAAPFQEEPNNVDNNPLASAVRSRGIPNSHADLLAATGRGHPIVARGRPDEIGGPDELKDRRHSAA